MVGEAPMIQSYVTFLANNNPTLDMRQEIIYFVIFSINSKVFVASFLKEKLWLNKYKISS